MDSSLVSSAPLDHRRINLYAERAILGAVLRNADAYRSVFEQGVRAEHFSVPLHQEIFNVVADLCAEGKRLAPPLICGRLPQVTNGVRIQSTIGILLQEAEDAEVPLDFVDDLIGAYTRRQSPAPTSLPIFKPITPATWKNTAPSEPRWLAQGRVPMGDVTILTANGGLGKTEIALQLAVSVAANLGDWLGCVVDSGPVLFLSCEEPEIDIRHRVTRICQHRKIDVHSLSDLHLEFPDLETTWLVSTDRSGKSAKTPLFVEMERWIERNNISLVVIDSVSAVFDGDPIAKKQVRSFLAKLRKLAMQRDIAILLIDHPSVRGMADGTGTANSVDWRNSVRAMMYLTGPDRNDPDARVLEINKANRGRPGEQIRLRWAGLTFATESQALASPSRAAAEREIDELFLRLLDKRNAQGRPLRPSTGRGSAPSELAGDPEANGTTVQAFRAAMERLYSADKIVTVETGPPAKRVKHIERAPGT
jgi:RecA-family ATPase